MKVGDCLMYIPVGAKIRITDNDGKELFYGNMTDPMVDEFTKKRVLTTAAIMNIVVLAESNIVEKRA